MHVYSGSHRQWILERSSQGLRRPPSLERVLQSATRARTPPCNSSDEVKSFERASHALTRTKGYRPTPRDLRSGGTFSLTRTASPSRPCEGLRGESD
ncbi:hypothetical protein MRX96_012316 [Rhipicephalus microplus]